MKILTALAATAFLSAATVGAAPASACGDGGKGRLMKLDVDGDGRLTKTELTEGMFARASERMAKVDTNKDGVIDVQEREAAHAARQAAHAERKAAKASTGEARADKGKRGKGHWAKGHGDRKDGMQRADANKDGRVDQGELRTAIETRVSKMMERLDANNDGALDASELPSRGHRRGKKA